METHPPSEHEPLNDKVLAVMVCDLEQSAIGTRSRLADPFPTPGANASLLAHVLERLTRVAGVQEITLLAPPAQIPRLWEIIGPQDRVQILPLDRRPKALDARIRAARAWNLLAWRGGAGQWTTFDEEYHPAAIAHACRAAFNNTGADHVLIVPSHAVFLDADITSQLVQHHLHKNHEMRVTYTSASPGLSGMLLRADIVHEMGEKQFLPGQLLAYDPKAPAFDTLIRDACMQVDPALSKIPNRFCADTDRAWQICAAMAAQSFRSAADMCLAAARVVAPGVRDLAHTFNFPREIQIDPTGQRLTTPPGSVPADRRARWQPLDVRHWCHWLSRQSFPDDLLVTLGGDADPLLYPGLLDLLRALRTARPISICIQTDLAGGPIDALLSALADGLVDVVSVSMYGHTRETYARVANADLHGAVMKNMEQLAAAVSAKSGMPLVVPRLLKVRDTIPELEPFFDFWVQRCGWAVIDGPTDRAAAIPFAGVVDMAPPKRKACRRIWERLLLRPDGTAVACDQDVADKLRIGNIETKNLPDMWTALNALRENHAAGRWNDIDPCRTCREWHRP